MQNIEWTRANTGFQKGGVENTRNVNRSDSEIEKKQTERKEDREKKIQLMKDKVIEWQRKRVIYRVKESELVRTRNIKKE